MKRTARITMLVLLTFLLLAALAALVSTSAGARVVRDGGTGGPGIGGKATADTSVWSVKTISFRPLQVDVPKLKPVPKVVHNTTKKNPPKNVKFDGEPMPGGITTGTGTAVAGAGEVVIPGVPGYTWRDGCGPTAVGMVVGYYDLHGRDDLIPGDATWNTANVQQAIASHGTVDAPGNYDDYALPRELYPNEILPDKSESPAGDEHASDCVADYMHTAWSADNLQYGFSYSNMVGPAFTNYVKSRYPSTSPTVTTFAGANLTWDIVKREVDAGRPMVLLVDSTGDGVTDHFVTLVGYREVNGYAEYGCWDTWDTQLIRWQRFRGISSTYQWGVWGGFTLSLNDAVTPPPSPSPSPTPSPTPTPTPVMPPAPQEDTTAPVTTQTGADAAWHNSSVKVVFGATDSGSGVAYTEYSVDGYGWQRGTYVTITVSKRTPTAVVHTLQYRSVDNAGNVETANFAQVKVDTIKPVTTSNADGATHAGSFTLVFTATDANSGVWETYYKVDSQNLQFGSSVVVKGAGRHTVRFYSVDNAGNQESTKSVAVRIR